MGVYVAMEGEVEVVGLRKVKRRRVSSGR